MTPAEFDSTEVGHDYNNGYRLSVNGLLDYICRMNKKTPDSYETKLIIEKELEATKMILAIITK